MKKTTVLLDPGDVEFLKEYGISPSRFARRLIRLVMEGKLRAPRGKKNEYADRVMISLALPEEYISFLRENHINLSALIREEVKKLKRKLD